MSLNNLYPKIRGNKGNIQHALPIQYVIAPLNQDLKNRTSEYLLLKMINKIAIILKIKIIK